MFNQIKEDIAVVFERDPAARTHLEIITTYPGVHALIIHRLSHWIWRKRFFLDCALYFIYFPLADGYRNSSRCHDRTQSFY